MSGISASREKGICDGLPCMRYTAPSTTTSTAGRIDPAIVPIEPIALDARTPGSVSSVAPQKNPSITTTRYSLFVASDGSKT